MKSIYVVIENKKYVLQSYLSRFFNIEPKLLRIDRSNIIKHSSTYLIEFDKLPLLLRRMIIMKFGAFGNENIKLINVNEHYVSSYFNYELKQKDKIIFNLIEENEKLKEKINSVNKIINH